MFTWHYQEPTFDPLRRTRSLLWRDASFVSWRHSSLCLMSVGAGAGFIVMRNQCLGCGRWLWRTATVSGSAIPRALSSGHSIKCTPVSSASVYHIQQWHQLAIVTSPQTTLLSDNCRSRVLKHINLENIQVVVSANEALSCLCSSSYSCGISVIRGAFNDTWKTSLQQCKQRLIRSFSEFYSLSSGHTNSSFWSMWRQ